jgi:type VI secretion system protein ImpN
MRDLEDGRTEVELAEAFTRLWTVLRFENGLERTSEESARFIQRVQDALDKGNSKLSEDPAGLIAGTFRQEERIHSGQSSVLWKLSHRETGAAYVLKTLIPAAASDQWQRDMLRREAVVGEQLGSRLFAAARILIKLNDGRPGLILNWGGSSLLSFPAQALAQAHFLETLAVQLLEALSELQEARLVHSDLAPANLLVSEDGRLRIADFGLCLAAGECHQDYGFTDTGTRAFRAPEQSAATPLSPAQDIYAAGLILLGLAEQVKLSSPRLTEVAKLMTEKEPARRPDARQALEMLQSD